MRPIGQSELAALREAELEQAECRAEEEAESQALLAMADEWDYLEADLRDEAEYKSAMNHCFNAELDEEPDFERNWPQDDWWWEDYSDEGFWGDL